MTNCALRFAATAAMPWPLATCAAAVGDESDEPPQSPRTRKESGGSAFVDAVSAFADAVSAGADAVQCGRRRAVAGARARARTAVGFRGRPSWGPAEPEGCGPPSTSRRPRPAARPTAATADGGGERSIGEPDESSERSVAARFGSLAQNGEDGAHRCSSRRACARRGRHLRHPGPGRGRARQDRRRSNPRGRGPTSTATPPTSRTRPKGR